jgi:hypothetical protein
MYIFRPLKNCSFGLNYLVWGGDQPIFYKVFFVRTLQTYNAGLVHRSSKISMFSRRARSNHCSGSSVSAFIFLLLFSVFLLNKEIFLSGDENLKVHLSERVSRPTKQQQRQRLSSSWKTNGPPPWENQKLHKQFMH